MLEVYTAIFYNDYTPTHETQIILQVYYIMIAPDFTYLPWKILLGDIALKSTGSLLYFHKK